MSSGPKITIKDTYTVIELRDATVSDRQARKENQVDECVDMALFREVESQAALFVVPCTLQITNDVAEEGK